MCHRNGNNSRLRHSATPHPLRIVHLFSLGLPLLAAAGCGSGISAPVAGGTPQSRPQSYFAPYVAGTTIVGSNATIPEVYVVDDAAHTFSQFTYQLQPPRQNGAQIFTSGITSGLPRGLLNLGITANYVFNSATNQFVATVSNPPAPGGVAVELASQAGGLMQLLGQPVAPLVSATACPNMTTTQTYQFVTIPGALFTRVSAPLQNQGIWSPTTQTAYGSVDIGASGSAVNFTNIRQFTLPSVGGSGAPAQPAPSSIAGACAPTFFGNTIAVPGQLVITNPAPGSSVPPQATVGIGPSGLLVEDNGNNVTGQYQAALGAGTGAIGLPRPSSPIDTAALAGSQYLGFIYGAGTQPASGSSTGWSSHAASFGFPAAPASCASVAPGSSTLIYGGDFSGDTPSTSPNGYGNCDFAIDLGVQDAANNGLYPHATVWIGSSYAANRTKQTYSFSAVAIAGQLQGKFAIFLLGVDSVGANSSQPWGIYLLQSN